MPIFPYIEILKKAYQTTRSHPWLWVFGLFLGGTSVFNSGIFNLAVDRFALGEPGRIKELYTSILDTISDRAPMFVLACIAVLAVSLILISLAALAFSSIIGAAARLTSASPGDRELNFRSAFASGKIFFWRVIGLQILTTCGIIILTLVLASPVVYLFSIGAAGRALVLLLFAATIFIPASLVFGFLHLYGPIFVVLYDRRIGEAMLLSFNLLRGKFKESVIMSAFLVGLNVLFILCLVFSIIVTSLPFALLIWLFLKLQIAIAAQIFIGLGLLINFVLVMVANAGFAVFQSVSWVLAVSEMVRTLKLQKEEKALAPEPLELHD